MSEKLRAAASIWWDRPCYKCRSHTCDMSCLEQEPEQEPVAWITKGGKGDLWWSRSVDEDGNNNLDDVPLYTAPPRREWVGLTGPEVDEAYGSVSDKEWAIGGLTDARVFFCAIEAKLREKNK